ncbi:4-hydroxythreonine-4-phosphate dehydrogenase PdxA [Legionella clemsonensis]|uniref:4-hydroxythreonine-4-phosphate dehydrogenase n=1 Tax=Legionella clemsonensis TaxID=1867846 RepID=A0A222P5Z3_9GAMM|nr:4-hydroxythreonine-4-phosphate dehydrogenase PdxA [Legionella clemsonensis]ASQ47243.1 4-hydroxythreonine-4-phosphate dehydrogenase 1 [Legionella clemsonensis]
MKPLLVSSGEPAGVGPDLCLALAEHELPVVILADKELLQLRAQELKLVLTFSDYQPGAPIIIRRGHLTVLSIPCPEKVVSGKLDPKNSSYVIEMLTLAADRCLREEFSGLITAPVHKAVINQAGIPFIGHTEFFATYCNTNSVVMMLACATMKVALVTTHLPLRAVADAISIHTVKQVIQQLNDTLKNDFSIVKPRLFVAGLNPHAGEGGYLGREEIEVITPALEQLKQEGIDVYGPFPADTMFTPHNVERCDAFVAMYHDQGLSVLKYVGFGSAVNVTLGLPFIRTSVDHGTALDLAGTGQAEIGSLLAAVEMAHTMAIIREKR